MCGGCTDHVRYIISQASSVAQTCLRVSIAWRGMEAEQRPKSRAILGPIVLTTHSTSLDSLRICRTPVFRMGRMPTGVGGSVDAWMMEKIIAENNASKPVRVFLR